MYICNLLKYYYRLCSGKEYTFVSSLEKLHKKLPNDIDIINTYEVSRAYSEYSSYADAHAKLQYAESEKCYKAVFRNVSCFANSDILLFRNGNAYCEIKTLRDFKNSACCDDGFILISDEPSWHMMKIPNVVKNIDKGIFLTGIYSWNFFHFFYAVLSKILDTEDIPVDVPLLVDESCAYTPSYYRLLEILNKQNRKIIYLKNNVTYNVGILYYISSPMIITPNLMPGVVEKPWHVQYDIEMLKRLRVELLPHRDTSRKYPSRIFVSRKNASSRRKFNENECIMFLKQYGFEVVYPETLTIEEQIAVFNSAETIVAGSGAALTNLIFCPKGCNILILIGYYHPLSIWQTLACVNDLNLYQINDRSKGKLGQKNNPYDIHNEFHVDIDKLKEYVTRLGYVKTFMLPVVTVSVMTYNSSEFIKETLDSIWQQTYPNIILQICDDNSSDNTLAICKGWIKMYGDRFVKIRIIESEKNTGISANCNRAWDNCETEYCKEIAGDDILLPNCIADNMAYAMENPDAKMIFSKMDVIPCDKNADDKTKKRHQDYVKSIDYSFFNLRDEERREILKTENHLLAPTLFTKVKEVKELGLRHDERVPDVEDYPKWINASNLGIKFHFMGIPTVSYRFHNNSISNASSLSWRYEHNLQLIEKYYGCKETTLGRESSQSFSNEDKQKLKDFERDLIRASRKNSKHLKVIRQLIGISALLALSLLISLIM